MNWQHFEVWSVDSDGHEDIVETTGSLKEARQIAEANITEYYVECIIYQEVEGELEEVERIR